MCGDMKVGNTLWCIGDLTGGSKDIVGSVCTMYRHVSESYYVIRYFCIVFDVVFLM